MVKNHSKQELTAKKAYENPKMEIIRLQAADVIVTSSFEATNEGSSSDGVWTGYY